MTDLPSFKRRPGRPPKNPVNNTMEETALRPSLREESTRDAAKRRAAELRAHSSEVTDASSDKFYIPPEAIPDGWHYEFKMHTVYGQENPTYQIQLAREGWTAVPASRHPEMMPLGSTEQTILRDGLILMECPSEIVEERRASELRKARMQVRVKEQQLSGAPDGHFERNKPQIKKAYSPVEIPE